MDGDLSDRGWQGATAITRWYETNVGDNVEPQVTNIAYLTYDDKYFYAGFEFGDPEPETVRAPVADHDGGSSATDYAGVIIDSRNDGKTAQMFLANLNGTEYDAITSDATGEDGSPDFFWDAAGKRTAKGWNLEIRIPFSSLRYDNNAHPTWGVLLYRNYPRDRRYQFHTARRPRDVNCFVCNASKLVGLEELPHGSHLVLAPYASAQLEAAPRGRLGQAIEYGPIGKDGGLDLKWNPSANSAIDLTINPDFSQIEADTAQITANQRFALFYAEKRPFFLEGIDLFATPIPAVYTRTITDPSAGFRVTGKIDKTGYTALVAEDQGGGQVILPGPQSSGLANQDFTSRVGIVRLKRDFGRSFLSFLTTTKNDVGGGHNRVFGPDFQWRPTPSDAITGEWLKSQSRTPNRPDLAPEWTGQALAGDAGKLSWAHTTERVDWLLQGQRLSDGFRADNGFVPQVGFDQVYLDGGFTLRPTGFINRLRFFTTDDYVRNTARRLLSRHISVGAVADARRNSSIRIELNSDDYEVASRLLHRLRPRIFVESRPGSVVNDVWIDCYFGQDVDFENARPGTGATISYYASVRPSEHLELRLEGSRQWLDETVAAGSSGRLFTAQVARLRATYSLNAHAFVRVIGQRLETSRDTSMYSFAVHARDATLAFSALFAYKINWQTVLFLGYGDNRDFLDQTRRLEKSSRQVFIKVSYAWQR